MIKYSFNQWHNDLALLFWFSATSEMFSFLFCKALIFEKYFFFALGSLFQIYQFKGRVNSAKAGGQIIILCKDDLFWRFDNELRVTLKITFLLDRLN